MLQVGTSTVDITPPVGSLMAAFPTGEDRIPRKAKAVHDPLLAKAIVISDGMDMFCICQCDLLFIQNLDVRRLRTKVGNRIPSLGGNRCIISCSHTHSGAETTYMFGNTPDDPYIEEMLDRMSRAIFKAHDSMEPAKMAVGSTKVELSHNRMVRFNDGQTRMVYNYDPEVTTGCYDSNVPLLRFDRLNGKTIAILYNFAAHSLTVGPNNFEYTADFPAVTAESIGKEYPNATVLFLNGAAGNQHPRKSMCEGFEATKEIGESLANALMPIIKDAKLEENCKINFQSKVLCFPHRSYENFYIDVELSCVSFGSTVMGFVPGEFFVEFQLEFKKSIPLNNVFFVAYSNGTNGYVAPKGKYENGYGIDEYKADPPQFSRTCLPKGAGEIVIDNLIKLCKNHLNG
jgi:hypothetical protein